MIKSYMRKFLALVLVVAISLFGCSANASVGLTGNYSSDTLAVLENLTMVIELPPDTDIEIKKETQAQARKQINEYISRYRKDANYGGLKSFTTMQTALNSLAGYYTSYGNRPMPEKLKQRLLQEFKQVQFAIKKGY